MLFAGPQHVSGQLRFGSTPRRPKFIVEAVDSSQRLVEELELVASLRDGLANGFHHPSPTGATLDVHGCDVVKRHLDLSLKRSHWRDASLFQRGREDVRHCAGIAPTQPSQLDDGLAVETLSKPVRGPQRYRLGGEDAEAHLCRDEPGRRHFRGGHGRSVAGQCRCRNEKCTVMPRSARRAPEQYPAARSTPAATALSGAGHGPGCIEVCSGGFIRAAGPAVVRGPVLAGDVVAHVAEPTTRVVRR